MTVSQPEIDYGVVRFSTDDFRAADGLTHWREACARTMMNVDMQPVSDAPFRCAASLRRLPQLGIASIATTPNRLTRSRDLVADGNDDLILAITLEGEADISLGGREGRLAPGQAWVITSREPSSTIVHTFSRFVSLAIPAAVLAPRIVGPDAALMPIPSENAEALSLLIGYLGSLGDSVALASSATRHTVVSHIHDLAVLAVGAAPGAADVARGRGMRAARLRAIKSDIMDNLDRQDFSIETVAVNQLVTPRYVRKLFESEGTSFSEFILAQRLFRAHRMLTDPQLSGWSISAIAFAVGFGDISYFNRTFRRRFAATPSEVRQLGATQG